MGKPARKLSKKKLILAGHNYLEGLTPKDRTIVALAAHDHLDFPGQECWENKQSILSAMNGGLVGRFRRQNDILACIGAHVTKYPGMKPKDLYANFSHDV
jgi:hypothetical protein